jgi:hypothetical protein
LIKATVRVGAVHAHDWQEILKIFNVVLRGAKDNRWAVGLDEVLRRGAMERRQRWVVRLKDHHCVKNVGRAFFVGMEG